MNCRRLTASFLILLGFQHCSSRDCVDPLVSPLYSSSFLASSRYNFLYSANFARLYGSSGWSPAPSDHHPWLQIDFRRKYRFVAISTQGTFNSYDWVTKYTVLYGDRPDAWTPYIQRGGNSTLSGNWNYYQVKRHVFHHAFTAKHLRFIPLGWNTENGGKIGVRLEVYGCAYDSYVMMYGGEDMAAYMFPGRRYSAIRDHIAINFKTLEREGLLLHSEGKQGDVLTLELRNARLNLHISLGSSTVHEVEGLTTLTAGNLLDDQHWHYVTIKRYGRQVSLTVDSQTERAICNGDFSSLDLDDQLYVGGVIEPNMPHLPDKANFHGCLENVFFNGINIIDMVQREDPQIRLPHQKKTMEFACADLLLKPLTFIGPNNYLQLPGLFRKPRMSVKFRFRSWDYTGLLMFTRFADNLGALELGLSEGQVNISLIQSEKRLQFAAGYQLNDGFWHMVDLVARDNFVTVTIDEDEGSPLKITNVFTVRTGDQYFFGGCPKTNDEIKCETKLNAFHGCMQQIFIDTEPVDIDAILQDRLGSYMEVLLGTCGITDRCTPDPCQHEGRCIQSWDDFICMCENTGYRGEVCQRSVYKESCESYRLNGKYYSGNYTIDPDLSGPLKPFSVQCNMKADKSWTVIRHNRIDSTKVTGSTVQQPYLGDVQYYNASWDEVTALANTSEYCEQWIEYSCYKSRLLNTPNGRPYSYWVGRHGESQHYWGGSFPGVQRCACAINWTCTDSRFSCNCDADYRQWYADKGWLNYRDHLPVRRIVIGDTNRTGSEVYFSLGSLRCHGDRNTWNTVAFTKPTYIKFPTFRPGTAADISFYFKTTADHGVFLENSDDHHRCFIRVELNSTNNLLFVFMVGDGIINVTLRSPMALNDDEWHYVEAEINVKLARLKVDDQPWAIRQFPGQTYVTMKFTQPLLVGAAKDKLRAFLGCIRGLRMNGVPLDLEGKVNEEEGIRKNCTGGCLDPAILCRNGGRCMERYASYYCDCNNTAFEGYYCHEDIGGYFEAGAWLRYSIRNEAISDEALWANWLDPHNFSLGYNQTSDEIEFSFSTTQAPAVLIYVSSFTKDYIAVILKNDGSLHLRYRLGLIAHKFQLSYLNLADGFPHFVNITRHNRTIRMQVDYSDSIWVKIPPLQDYWFDSPKAVFLGRVMEMGEIDYEVQRHNSPGFVGCLSGVRYDIYAPLKTYFRPNETDPPVTVQGFVVESNCGVYSSVMGEIPLEADPWFTGFEFVYIHDDLPTPLVMAFLILLLLVLVFGGLYTLYLYLYRYKGSYHTNEPKSVGSPGSSRALTESSRRRRSLAEIQEEPRSE
ncbi:contactin-associated protein 1 [Paramormyrops kingsleyae]|uniref:Contactin associated protein 1 n=1 Tax=Paramormyrops kingsleyae TaxID=1676925 RepID=A0A3B3Q4W0_9TELE|nr:contactin-associated protein 1 [Paramormyrops kingsleyae]XP_023691164.1 contactin-associated protein 1 [Paramormyrops kingsleyae]XP_023691165.1 contactin-associated protein 1 [Paramormyrops kingsleyae]